MLSSAIGSGDISDRFSALLVFIDNLLALLSLGFESFEAFSSMSKRRFFDGGPSLTD